MELILFAILAIIAVAGALVTVTHRNPVYCAMGLVLCFIAIAGFFLLLNAPFLAAVQVIIYAGSIMTLFIFVIMLMDLGRENVHKLRVTFGRLVASLLGFILLIELLLVVNGGLLTGRMGSWTPEKIKAISHTKVLGQVLLTEYLYPFEAISLLLVVAMVGAILIGKKKD